MVERSKRIELRVTADELRQIHERMQEAGISSLTAYMIRMALHGYVSPSSREKSHRRKQTKSDMKPV